MDNNIHVIFGMGALGQATARALLAQGARVRMVSRSGSGKTPAGVEVIKADIGDEDQARSAAKNALAIYQCVGIPYDIKVWRVQWPRAQSAGLAAARANAAKYIFGDNLYMYGDTNGAPVDETSPDTATTQKGRLRATIARMVLDAHSRGDVRAAIVRGSDFFGPGVYEQGVIGQRSVGAMLAGKPAQFIGSIDLPHTFTLIDDFGAAMATVGLRDEALGQIWHAPNPETLTTRQIMTKFATAANMPVRYQMLSRPLLTVLGLFMPAMGELREMLYGWEKPYVVRSEKITNQLGLRATPMDSYVNQTLEWFRSMKS